MSECHSLLTCKDPKLIIQLALLSHISGSIVYVPCSYWLKDCLSLPGKLQHNHQASEHSVRMPTKFSDRAWVEI